jgi:hypothetical protein
MLSNPEVALQVVNEVEISAIQNHLHNLGTGVLLEKNNLPSLDDGQWHGYKVILDCKDIDRIILWWENEKYTQHRTCRVTDLLPFAKTLERVQSFIVGCDARGFPPIDLKSGAGMELCMIADSISGDFLYVIDGNHRLIAHWFQGRSLDGVPSYVAAHEGLKSWAYIPKYWKTKWLA